MRGAILTHCPDLLTTRKEGMEATQKISEKQEQPLYT